MAQWKFQLCPNEKDSLGKGFRVDPVAQAVEDEINDALRYPFKFHGVIKIVIRFGPSPTPEKDYVERITQNLTVAWLRVMFLILTPKET